jgi:hypothetical protein
MESGGDLLRFILNQGLVAVPAVEVGPFEFGIFNHKKCTKTGHGNSCGAILRNFAPFAVNQLGEFLFWYGFVVNKPYRHCG